MVKLNYLNYLIVFFMAIIVTNNLYANDKGDPMTQSVHEFNVSTISGEEISLSQYKGKVLLIVNTASKCGFTPQFEGLEKLYQMYSDKDFYVLGFPCNQFANQDPGTEKDILEFCQLNYGVTFPMFSKIDVNGDNTAPLYKYLKSEAPGILGSEKIKWNFTKFLVDRDGKVVERFGSKTAPEKLDDNIEKLLGLNSN